MITTALGTGNSELEQTKKMHSAEEEKMAEVHNTYMKQLHEWQRMCNFHYAFTLQYHGMQMMHARRPIPSAPTTTPVPAAPVSTRPSQSSGLHPRFEYKLAPIVYRLTAEFIDFLILMAMKMFFLVSYMRLTGESVENVSYQFLLADDMSLVDEMTIEDLQHMMLMGLLYRILACVYEALFIALTGATPGKMIMRLEVISCKACVSVQRGNQRYVSVYPGSTPSTGSSAVRSIIKNFSITFLMPAFLTVFFYQHNRTSYDLVANTLVVRSNS